MSSDFFKLLLNCTNKIISTNKKNCKKCNSLLLLDCRGKNE